MRQLLNLDCAYFVLGHLLTSIDDPLLAYQTDALVSMSLDYLSEFHQVLSRGGKSCLEDGGWQLVLLTVETRQRDLNEVLFVAFFHDRNNISNVITISIYCSQMDS